jgi:hypothetical protein
MALAPPSDALSSTPGALCRTMRRRDQRRSGGCWRRRSAKGNGECAVEIIYSSNRGSSKQFLLDYLRRMKAANSGWKVLDIGGAYCPWTAEVADAFADLFPIDGQDVLIGDINEEPIWEEISQLHFDFCICSHTLEDVRNSPFILARIRELFRIGYIAMPNKHVEFSHVESKHWIGYAHHRWVYTLAEHELRMIAKFPLTSFFSPPRRPIGRLTASRPFQAIKKLWTRPGRIGLSDIGYLPWWRPDLAERSNELAFIWAGDLRFKAINNDYASDSIQELARLYRDELAEGL